MRASWQQRGAAAHGRSTRTASSGWHCRAGPDGTSEGAHRGARSRETAHQLRRQGGTLAELAPVLASVPTVNASPQRWRYGFANEWRSCGLGIRPACPGRGAVRRPSCSHAPVTSRSPRHRALIRLRWPAVACPLGCSFVPDLAATFVITQEYGDPDREMAAALDLAVVGRTDGRRRRTGRAPLSPRSARHGRSRTRVSWTADGRPRHGRRDWMPDLEVALLGDSYPGVPVGQAAEFWSSSRAADELRPAQPCFGNGREGTRLPTHRMRQLDPGRSVVRVSASGLGSNE